MMISKAWNNNMRDIFVFYLVFYGKPSEQNKRALGKGHELVLLNKASGHIIY